MVSNRRTSGCVCDRDVSAKHGGRSTGGVFAQVGLGLGKGFQVGGLQRGEEGSRSNKSDTAFI